MGGVPAGGKRLFGMTCIPPDHAKALRPLASARSAGVFRSGRLAGVLAEQRERALLFRTLARLREDEPLFDSVTTLRWSGPTPGFRDYAARVVRTARALAAGLADQGVRLVSGGTDSHLSLCDVRPLGIGG